MSSYDEKIIAITGGTGFIGSRLAERLALEHHARVRVLVRTWQRATWVSRADVRLVPGDVTARESLEPLVKDAETVFHCAKVGGGARRRPVNVEGTRNVLAACNEFGVKRIVHFSTVGVHGPTLHEGLDENAPFLKLGQPYADSKIEAEEIFWEYTATHDLEGTLIRPTYVWGPNSPLFTVAPFRQILAKRFALVDRGAGACNAVHVDNVVDLALRAGYHPRAVGEAFLVRDGDRLSWAEFFGYYAAMAGIDLSSLRSVPSHWSASRALSRGIRFPLEGLQKPLTAVIERCGNRMPLAVKYGLKAPRRLLQMAARATEALLPDPYGWWDLRKYSSPGYISIEKAKRLLDYSPRVTVEQGMTDCELWLRDQNYMSVIPRATRPTSPTAWRRRS